MKITLSTTAPSQIETECLVVAVVDASEKAANGNQDKPKPQLLTADSAVLSAAADLLSSGEATGKALETTLLHKPAGLKGKRLLLIGGGKAKTFSTSELRKIAGTAVRAIKAKDLKTFALVAPATGNFSGEDAAKSIAEGAYVGAFDADYYKSDRKEQTIDELTVIAPADLDLKSLQSSIDVGTIIGEAQNFTRDLVNEPGNRMTPTILADRAKTMSDAVGLQCEIYGPDKIKELKMGAFWSVAQG
jgi:leucyl aminopeptidase